MKNINLIKNLTKLKIFIIIYLHDRNFLKLIERKKLKLFLTFSTFHFISF